MNHTQDAFVERERAVQRALDSFAVPAVADRPGACRTIIEQVAAKHDVKAGDIIGPRRMKQILHARQEALYRCVDETSLSLPTIGRAFGDRNHSTIIHAVRVYAKDKGLGLPRGMREAN